MHRFEGNDLKAMKKKRNMITYVIRSTFYMCILHSDCGLWWYCMECDNVIIDFTKDFQHSAFYKDECMRIKDFISLSTREDVRGLFPMWGSAPVLQRAITESLWFFHAALNRGELFPPFSTFTSALASKSTGTAAGLSTAAICKGEHCRLSCALTSAPASISALTTEAEL